jgi:hypothetical protein
MKPKLNPEELVVSSFETTPDAGDTAIRLPTIDTSTDPTAQTFCYWCPPATFDCY